MADRTRSTTTNTGASRSRAATQTGVRRNLFQGQLTRRPTASSSNSAETLHLPDLDVLSESSEIIVRDNHGEVELWDPPALMLEDEDEVPVDERLKHENEERQRLAEVVKNYQINHNTSRGEPEELLAEVREVLKTRVASLADDNWMFEPEEQPRG